MNVTSPDLSTKVAFLSRPENYPERPAHVVTIETHMSWVFLVRHHVYKLRKPIRTDYLDFSTLDKRHLDCAEEIRLNRELAPGVYLGIVALTQAADGALQLDGKGRPVEWLVKMRRLPRERMLDARIRQGEVTDTEVERFARVLVNFYRHTPHEPMPKERYLHRLINEIHRNHRVLLTADRGLDEAWLERLRDRLLTFVERHEPLLEESARRVVEAHGDLRPEHICLTDPPLFIDRLEFNRDFRRLDPVEELAYLAMECEFMRAAWIGDRVLGIYRSLAGVEPPPELTAFFKAFRAHLRARLSASHLTDHPPRDSVRKWLDKTQAYLELAWRHLSSPIKDDQSPSSSTSEPPV